MSSPKARRRRPPTRDIYAILVALSEGEKSATELQSQVVADTAGVHVPLTSVLTVLKRLKETGLVESRWQRSYMLTDQGWQTLTVESKTLEGLVQLAKRRVIESGRGRW